jgi:hypothetical protein
MPTDPRQDILYRELSQLQANELNELTSPLIQEVVNFATNAFVRCMSYSESDENVDLAPFALHRHVMEMTDAVEVLLSNACPVPAIPLLRSSFEAVLYLEYIVEDDDLYERRSLTWLASYVRQRLARYETLLPTTPRGQDFLEAIEQDKTIREFPSLPAEEVEAGIENLRKLLSRDQFDEIQREFDEIGGFPKWYSLFGGPRNLRELAQQLRLNTQYDVLYRQWSMATHAQDFSPFIARGVDGERGIRGLRDVEPTKHVATFAVVFLLNATRLLINKFHPGEPWGNWYMKEVRDSFMTVVGQQ